MSELPDFRYAHFTVSDENPFRLTPPRDQANFDNVADASKRASSGRNASPPYPNPEYEDVFDALKNAVKQRTKQGTAFLSLFNSELMLIKRSLLITIVASMAVFVISMVCWVVLNVGLSIALYSVNLSVFVIICILLCINVAAAILLFRLAKNASQLVSFERVIGLIKRSLLS